MNQYRSDIRRIMTAVNTIDGIYALEAKKIGLKENTLSLLYALDDGKAHSQTQICEEWLIPRTTVNTIVKECIRAGYVTLEAEKHSREKRIRLTDSEQKYAKDVLAQVYSIMSPIHTHDSMIDEVRGNTYFNEPVVIWLRK